MMRYKLVIAEKPSVAQSLAAVIGATARKDGYLEGNGWRVSWCVGHLAGLADADSYDPKYAKWRYDDLPILPEHWQMVVGKDKKKQFDILKKLMNAPDVTEVVNACDAGREGELIFRSVYELAGCQKPMKRLWISSMEDSAIREGFANLRPGVDYDGLRDAALCRAKADWLVGINATRLFSVLYHRTLNIGRVMSPTLALIVQREAEIDTFQPVPFYTVALELPGLTISGDRMADKAAAEQLKEACQGAAVTIKKVECKEKSEKPPALYDLTTLQRDANRLLGFTAQQTLDYLQSLYEKKLCTYPRTDSRYLTGDMADSLPVLVNLVANAMPFRKGIAITCDPQTVINDKKVTDHHAVIPTRNLKDADLSALPAGEKAVLELVALRLLCAVAQPHIYSETVVIAACAGGEFTAKGKTVKHPGWKALEDAYRAKMKDAEPKKEGAEKALPELTEGQTLSVAAAIIKEGKSSPPQHFTEDTLLSAMETAGKEDMPEDAERKGLGTPATRAGILEKLVSAGFLERKKNRKTVQLLPSHDAVSLITVLPEQLQSPLLTAEWEYRLGEIERGQLAPEEFLDGISTMLKDLVGTYQVIKGTEYLFTPPREVVGKCPRCGGEVAELQKGFFCQNKDCKFAIWKNNKWWAAKKKQPTKAVVSALLKDGRVSRNDPQNVRFMNLDWLESHDVSVDRSNYDLIYTAPLSESGTVPEQLEKLYQQFNLEKPVDFHSPSMSVSDIVAIKQDGKVSCHYCDSVGFTQIPGFLPENPLKNAEMALEDDYGMIDGIINNGAKEPTVAELEQQARSGQPISLMELAAATHREEREKKKSVMEQLKGQPKTEHKKTAPKKSAEREI